ncbi:hypothetical protein AXF42_Ash008322 [Apostasia shenzhenica]|uniref:Uncharacterized protein n=1 Tax=Apostasia shenzhenica TaxID=1088818 RepID=A0A2I0AXJ4_9ASPA|nr:hypothetical protein AXF42_Ash008322 [Apostasia shenzhenica]
MMENFIVERAWAGVALGWVTSWRVLKSRSFFKVKADNISILRSRDVTTSYPRMVRLVTFLLKPLCSTCLPYLFLLFYANSV